MQSEKYPHNHPSHSKTSIAAAGGEWKSAYRAKRGDDFLRVPIVRIRQAGPDRIGIHVYYHFRKLSPGHEYRNSSKTSLEVPVDHNPQFQQERAAPHTPDEQDEDTEQRINHTYGLSLFKLVHARYGIHKYYSLRRRRVMWLKYREQKDCQWASCFTKKWVPFSYII